MSQWLARWRNEGDRRGSENKSDGIQWIQTTNWKINLSGRKKWSIEEREGGKVGKGEEREGGKVGKGEEREGGKAGKGERSELIIHEDHL